jgi:hypothetical protein
MNQAQKLLWLLQRRRDWAVQENILTGIQDIGYLENCKINPTE